MATLTAFPKTRVGDFDPQKCIIHYDTCYKHTPHKKPPLTQQAVVFANELMRIVRWEYGFRKKDNHCFANDRPPVWVRYLFTAYMLEQGGFHSEVVAAFLGTDRTSLVHQMKTHHEFIQAVPGSSDDTEMARSYQRLYARIGEALHGYSLQVHGEEFFPDYLKRVTAETNLCIAREARTFLEDFLAFCLVKNITPAEGMDAFIASRMLA